MLRSSRVHSTCSSGSRGSSESLSSVKVGGRRKLVSTSAPQFRDSQEKWPQQQETGSGWVDTSRQENEEVIITTTIHSECLSQTGGFLNNSGCWVRGLKSGTFSRWSRRPLSQRRRSRGGQRWRAVLRPAARGWPGIGSATPTSSNSTRI